MTDKLHVTAEMLRNHDACEDQVELFLQTFPQGATVPDDLDTAARAGLDTRWAFRVFGLTGMAERYYENGQLQYRKHYEQGELHGRREGWYRDGQLWYRAHYEHGELIRGEQV